MHEVASVALMLMVDSSLMLHSFRKRTRFKVYPSVSSWAHQHRVAEPHCELPGSCLRILSAETLQSIYRHACSAPSQEENPRVRIGLQGRFGTSKSNVNWRGVLGALGVFRTIQFLFFSIIAFALPLHTLIRLGLDPYHASRVTVSSLSIVYCLMDM